MSINPRHLRELVVVPTLQAMAAAHGRAGLSSPAAVELLMGTAWQESRAVHLVQLGGGPARGIWQVEPATARWLDQRLRSRRYAALRQWVDAEFGATSAARIDRMAWDLRCGCYYARLRFWVVPEPLPRADLISSLARYWKQHYNTEQGAGTVAQWTASYQALRRAERGAAR